MSGWRRSSLLLVLFLALAIALPSAHASWWNTSWQQCQDISITTPGPLTNVPVFLNIPSQTGMQSDYDDLRFINASCGNGGSEMDFEFEYRNASQAQLWVELPTTSTTTQIALYFENDAVSTTANANAVWTSDYGIVYHMNTTGTDSTSNSRDRVGDIGTPTQAITDSGLELVLDGSTDAWDQTDLTYWEAAFSTRSHTVAFRTGNDVTTRQVLFAEGGGTNGVMMYIVSGSLYARWWSESDGWTGNFLSSTVSNNTEYVATMEMTNPGDYELFVNGVSIGTGTTPSGIASHIGNGGIGYTNEAKDFHDLPNSAGHYFGGEILEMHVRDTLMGQDQHNLTYQTLLNQGSVVTLDSPVNQAPQILSQSFVNTSLEQNDSTRLTVTVSDSGRTNTVSSVTAEIEYPNVSRENLSLSQEVLFDQTSTSGNILLENRVFTANDGSTIIGESGNVTLTDDNITIAFANQYESTPVVLATVVTENSGVDGGEIFVINAINSTHMNVSMCKDNGATGCIANPTAEEFHYFVFDTAFANTYSWMEVGTIDGVTNGGDTLLTFDSAFSNVPYVFVSTQTRNDAVSVAPSVWTDTPTINNVQIIGCTHQGSGDSCTTGSTETFGYVAIDPVLANITGMQFGSASISDSTYTPATFSPSFTNPRAMVMQNDDNGGQDPQYHEARFVTGSGMDFRYCEQDALGVCNSHTGELTVWFAAELGNLIVPGTPDNEVNTSLELFSSVLDNTAYNITQVQVDIAISEYDNSGSIAQGNNDADVLVELQTSSGFLSLGEFGVNGTGSFSLNTTDSDVLSTWETLSSRNVRLQSTYLDFVNESSRDNITISQLNLTIMYDNETETWTYDFPNVIPAGVYNITSINATSDIGASNFSSQTNLTFTVTVTTPSITNIQNTSITDISAIILWDTDELANSTVQWGITPALGNSTSDATFVTTRGIALSGLIPNTTYYYNVTSCDPYNNCNASNQFSFTTALTPDLTPPTIENITVTNITETTATISWQTNEAANATLEFGGTTTLGLTQTSTIFLFEQEIDLTSLLPFTTYFYNITACDSSNNCNTTGPFTFDTLDLTAPSPSGILANPASPVTYSPGASYEFNVTWTDSASGVDTVIIEKNFSGTLQNTTLIGGPTYQFQISDLAAGVYQWRMFANDSANNTAVTANQTFIVERVQSDITLLTNQTFTNKTINEFSSLTINATLNTPNNGSIQILRDGTPVISGASPLFTTEAFNLAGIFSVRAEYAGNQNYSPASKELLVTVREVQEFVNNTVQAETGVVSLGSTVTEVNVSLTNTYNLSKTFLKTHHMATGTGGIDPANHATSVEFANETHLTIRRFSSGVETNVSYSILQADNIEVQNFTKTWTSGEESAQVTLQNSLPTNYAEKCWVETRRNMRLNSGDANDHTEFEVRTQFIDEDTLSLERDTVGGATANPGVQIGFVICFLDGGSVQEGAFSISGGTGSEARLSIGTVNRSASFSAITHFQADDGVGTNAFLADIEDANTLVIHRDEDDAGQTAFGQYYVMSFEEGSFGEVQHARYLAPGTGTLLEYNISINAIDQNKSFLSCENTMAGGGGTAYTRGYWTFDFNDSNDQIIINEGRDRGNGQDSDVLCQVLTWPNQTTYIPDADLSIAAINFSPVNVVEGQPVTINVSVNNTKAGSVQNVTLHINVSRWNGTQWVFNQTLESNIEFIPKQTVQVFQDVWIAQSGRYQFNAYIDANNSEPETNELNNNLTAEYNVSSWHIYYGSGEQDLRVLGQSASLYLREWTSALDNATLITYDQEFDIDFTSLAPLNQSGDLIEADIALGLRGNTDSISELWDRDQNGFADTNETFTIAGTVIDVPVINTTSSANFLTGILYDSSSSSPYDGSQNIIIITKLNPGQTGSFGTYDYEIRLPSTLGDQFGSSSSISLAVEVS